jgi:hypothetical protein
MRIILVAFLFALAACAPAEPPAEAGTAAVETPEPAAETGAAGMAAGDTVAEGAADAAAVDAQNDAAATGDPAMPEDTPANPAVAHLRGRVSYPSEELPAMRVCALATEDMGLGYCTRTKVNAPHYDLKVPPGTWILLAWPQDTGTEGAPGLLSQASECLATAGLNCDDHDFLELTVDAGEVREGLDINDWYYPPEAPPLPMEPRGETLE